MLPLGRVGKLWNTSFIVNIWWSLPVSVDFKEWYIFGVRLFYNMAAILRNIFSNAILGWKCSYFAKFRFEVGREANCIIVYFTIFNCNYFVFWWKMIALQKKHIILYIVRIVSTAFCWTISRVCKCLIKYDFNFSTLGTVKMANILPMTQDKGQSIAPMLLDTF